MEQETLIYIEERDKNEAAKLAGNFTIEDTFKRAYINALGGELAMKYLAQEEINVANIYNLHNIYKIREEFDIADIMLPNIHLDVRMVYDENFIFIPKSHFEYNLTPDIYLVFLMLDGESCVKFLGFFEPKIINKNNHNDKYYFIEKEKLSHPSDLKSYIKNFNGNTTEAISEEELENGQNLAMSLIDHDITDENKLNLFKTLVKSSALREALIEFDNFEWISYHVATTEELTSIPEVASLAQNTIQPLKDEFDVFEQPDEFSEPGGEASGESEEGFNEPDEELNKSEEELGEPEEELGGFGSDNLVEETPLGLDLDDNLINNSTDEQLNSFSEDLTLDFSDQTETLQNLSGSIDVGNDSIEELPDTNNDTIEDLTIEEPINISSDNLTEDLTDDFSGLNIEPVDDMNISFNEDSLEGLNNENTLEDTLLSEADFAEPTDNVPEELNFNEELPELSGGIEALDENINSDELNESQTGTPEINADETIDADNLINLSFDTDTTSEDFSNLDIYETSPEDLTNFEVLGERDDIKHVPETPFVDEERTLIENIAPVEEPVYTEDDSTLNEPTDLNNIEIIEEITPSEDLAEESASTIPFDSFDTIQQDTMSEENINQTPEQPINPEELFSNVSDIETNIEDINPEDFLEALAQETAQENETTAKQPVDNTPVSYENSTVINNQNYSPGEFNIDINQLDNNISNSNDNIEKLEVLYNKNNNFQNNEDNLQFKTALPEKGKKAIAVTGVVVAALATLLIYSSISKPGNQIAEKNNVSVLEKNLPTLDEQEIPEENTVLPAKPSTNIEDTAKNAAQNINKPDTPAINAPYLDVSKISWSVPDYVSYNDTFRNYLQTAGKSLKLSLSSDLLLATEYAYSNQIQVNIVLSREGTIQNSNIIQSSGSSQIDEIVLRTVNDTLKVVKAPAGVIVGDNIQLTLKIYL